jgi:hypothetical protein
MPPLKDLTGQRFGKLVCLGRAGTATGKAVLWLFQCDCGNQITTVLRQRRVKSCGCLKITHGKSSSRIYQTWWNMYRRCYDPKDKSYDRYGARGIRVCEEWLGSKESFFDWALSNGYEDSLTLDRKDGSKGYSPDNCRWATTKQQARNKSSNVWITYGGKTMLLNEWARYLKTYTANFYALMKKGLSPTEAVQYETARLSGRTR